MKIQTKIMLLMTAVIASVVGAVILLVVVGLIRKK